MAMPIGSLIADLILESASFISGLNQSVGAMKGAADKMSQQATAMEKGFAGVGKAAGALKTGLAAIGVGVGVGALIQMTRKSLDVADALHETSRGLGVTAEELQTFRFAAEQTGSSVGGIEQALGKFSRNIGDALAGETKFGEILAANNIKLRDASGNVRPLIEIFADYADVVQKAGSQSEATALSFDAFGRGGQSTINLMREGRAGILGYAEELRKLGLINADQAAAADAANDALNKLSIAFSTGLQTALVAAAPAIEKLANGLVSLVEWFNQLSPGTQSLVGTLTAMTAGLTTAGLALAPFAIALGALASPVAIIAAGIIGAGGLLYALYSFREEIGGALLTALKTTGEAFVDLKDTVLGAFTAMVEGISEGLQAILPDISGPVANWWDSLAREWRSKAGAAASLLVIPIPSLPEIDLTGWWDQITAGMDLLMPPMIAPPMPALDLQAWWDGALALATFAIPAIAIPALPGTTFIREWWDRALSGLNFQLPALTLPSLESVLVALDELGQAFVRLRDTAIGAVTDMVAAVKTALTTELSKTAEASAGVTIGMARQWLDLYNKVVGQSYVPELIQGIAYHFSLLDRVMVQPSQRAMAAVNASFANLRMPPPPRPLTAADPAQTATLGSTHLGIAEMAADHARINERLGQMPAKIETVNVAYDLLLDTSRQFAQGVASGFTEAIFAGESLKETFNNLAMSLAKAVTEAIIFNAIMQAIGQRGTVGGPAGTGLMGMMFSPTPRQHGGPVMAGRPYWVGERGQRELFVPSQAGSIIPTGTGGGGAPNITIIDQRGRGAPPIETNVDSRGMVSLLVRSEVSGMGRDGSLQRMVGARRSGTARG